MQTDAIQYAWFPAGRARSGWLIDDDERLLASESYGPGEPATDDTPEPELGDPVPYDPPTIGGVDCDDPEQPSAGEEKR